MKSEDPYFQMHEFLVEISAYVEISEGSKFPQKLTHKCKFGVDFAYI